MTFFARLRQSFAQWGTKQRSWQESVDSQKALVFTTWYKEIMEKGRDDKELLDKALDRVMSLSDSKKEKELRGNLNEQVQRLFEFIHEATEKARKANLAVLVREKTKGEEEQWRSMEHLNAEHQKMKRRILQQSLKRDVGFSLRLAPSTIPTAGQGVFLEGSAKIGAVLGFVPGLVYLPEHLSDPEVVQSLFPDPDFMLTQRYDKIIIDSRYTTDIVKAEDADGVHMYAQGHMVNHGTAADKVNVMTLAYDFPQDPFGVDSFPEQLRPYIPNRFVQNRTYLGSPDHSALIQSMVVIAKRDLKDEELFVNYRLNPNLGTLPPWYRTIDAEEDMRRWA